MVQQVLGVLLIILTFATVQCARLRVVEAGKSGRKGPELENGFKVCPRDFFGDSGISIECESEQATAAQFFLDGKRHRREGVKPFLMAGDSNGEVFVWKPPTGTVTLGCVGQNEAGTLSDSKRVSGSFDCPPNPMKPEPPLPQQPISITPSDVRMVVREAGKVNGKSSEPLEPMFKFCPRDFASSITLECVAPGASSAEMVVDDKVVRNEGTSPFMMAGDLNGNAFPWVPPSGTVTVGCRTDVGSVWVSGRFDCDGTATPSPATTNTEDDTDDEEKMPSPTPEPAPRVGVSQSYCVKIPTQMHMNSASEDWVPDGMALTYHPNSTFGGTVGPNRAPLRYTFTVPVSSTYFIALDSDTKDKTEHNDAWIQFDSVTLRRNVDGEIMEMDSTSKALKAYQNNAGRFTGAFSVDHEPHSFATTQVLEPGETYEITVSARSTMFKLYGIILWPCAKEECVRFSEHSRRYAGLCKF